MRCAVHTFRRLQQIAISCKRSDSHKKILQGVTSEQLSEEAALRVALFCDAAHATSSEVLDFDEFYELHQESFHFHHDVLDEEDDECHFQYCQKRNRCKSPD